MALIFWLTLGLLVGGIAKVVLWDERGGSWVPVLLAAAAGGVLGGFARGALFGASDVPGFDPATMGLAILGAAVLLAIYYALIGRAQSKVIEFEDRPRRAA